MDRLYYNDFIHSQRQTMGVLALLNKLHWKMMPDEMDKTVGEANDLLINGKIYFDKEKEQYYFE